MREIVRYDDLSTLSTLKISSHTRISLKKPCYLFSIFALFFTLASLFTTQTSDNFIYTPHPKQLTDSQIRLSWSSRRSTLVQQQRFNAPFQNHRFTYFHSVLRSQNDTFQNDPNQDSYVHTLAFIERTPLKKQIEPQWHVLVPESTKAFEKIDCEYRHQDARGLIRFSKTVGQLKPFDGQTGIHIICPLSRVARSFVSEPINAKHSLFLTVRFLSGTIIILEQGIELNASPVPIQPAQNAASICVSPLHKTFNAKKVIQWREHHRLLGIDTVYWYARPQVEADMATFDSVGPQAIALADWIDDYNRITGTSDTLIRAPPVDPDIYGTNVLEDAGEYADQVTWYADCQMRSLSNPTQTEWLAYIDIDEFLLPSQFPHDTTSPSAALSGFLNSLNSDVGAVCIGRTHVDGNKLIDLPDIGTPQPTRYTFPLAAMQTYRAPHTGDQYDNAKCLYRAKAIEVGHVHNPTSLFKQENGQDYEILFKYEASALRIVHLGWWALIQDDKDFKKVFQASDDLKRYLVTLWHSMQTVSMRLQGRESILQQVIAHKDGMLRKVVGIVR